MCVGGGSRRYVLVSLRQIREGWIKSEVTLNAIT